MEIWIGSPELQTNHLLTTKDNTMTDKTYKNLAVCINVPEPKETKNGGELLTFEFSNPNYQDPKKKFFCTAFDNELSDSTIERLATIGAGEEVCVETKKDGKYTRLVALHDKSEAPAPSKQNATYKSNNYSGGGGKPKSDSGVATGAAYTNAIEIIKLSEDAPTKEAAIRKKVKELALAILQDKLEIESQYDTLKANTKKSNPTTQVATKKKSKMQIAKEKAAKEKQTKPKKEDPTMEVPNDSELDDIAY